MSPRSRVGVFVLGYAHTSSDSRPWPLCHELCPGLMKPSLSRKEGRCSPSKEVTGWGSGTLWVPSVLARHRHSQVLVCSVAEEGKELPFYPSAETGADRAPPGAGKGSGRRKGVTERLQPLQSRCRRKETRPSPWYRTHSPRFF